MTDNHASINEEDHGDVESPSTLFPLLSKVVFPIYSMYHVGSELLMRKLFQISPWKLNTMNRHRDIFRRQTNSSSFNSQLNRIQESNWTCFSCVRLQLFQCRQWLSYTLFPMKCACHLLLIAFLAIILLTNNSLYASYQRSAAMVSCRYFQPFQTCSYQSCVGYLSSTRPSLDQYACSIYKKREVQASILESINNYFHINSTSLAQFAIPSYVSTESAYCSPDSRVQSPQLVVALNDGTKVITPLNDNLQEVENVLAEALSPLSLIHLLYLELRFPLQDSFAYDLYSAQYTWAFQVVYLFQQQSKFELRVSQRLTQICHIHRPSLLHSGDTEQTLSVNDYQASDSLADGDRDSLYQQQRLVRVCEVIVLGLSVVYICVLIREMRDNTRLLMYISDVLDTDSQSSNSTAMDISAQRSRSATTADCIKGELRRRLLNIPSDSAVVRSSEKSNRQAPAELYEQSNSSSELNEQRRSVSNWSSLSWKVKVRILDGWRLMAILASIGSLAVCVHLLDYRTGRYCSIFSLDSSLSSPTTNSDDRTHSYTTRDIAMLLGVSLALHCMTILHYFRYNNRFTASSIVLWGAFFKVQRILLSVLPLTAGALLLGTLLFGNSVPSFGSLSRSFISLFAVMNCDSLYDIFAAVINPDNGQALSALYICAVFLLLNILTLRIVLAVVESLYFFLRLYNSSRRKRMLWRRKLLAWMHSGRDEHTNSRARRHTSEKIQESLLQLYASHLPTSRTAPIS